MRSGVLNLLTRQILVVLVVGELSEFVISPDLRRGIRVQGIVTIRGVQHLQEANPRPRRAMEVMSSVPERNVASVAVFTMESAS